MVLALELPPDLAYNETIVTLTGQTEAVIENNDLRFMTLYF